MGMDLKKYSKAAVGKMLDHYDRYEGKNVKYHNRDIDTSLSSQNYNLTDVTTAQARENLYQRIRQLDDDWSGAGKKVTTRKDRVIMVGCIIDCPKVLVGTGREDEFFKLAYEWECEAFGKENVIDCAVHKDEVHDYIDDRTDEWTASRWHMHSAIVPAFKDKETSVERVYAKGFMDKTTMSLWHKDLDKFIFSKMGIHTLKEEPWTGKSIEMSDLKQRSREKARKEQALAKELNVPLETPKPLPIENRTQFLLPKDEAIYKRADVDNLVNENAELRSLIAANEQINTALTKQAEEKYAKERTKALNETANALNKQKMADSILAECKQIFKRERFSKENVRDVMSSGDLKSIKSTLQRIKDNQDLALLDNYRNAVTVLSSDFGSDVADIADEFDLWDLKEGEENKKVLAFERS